MHPEAHAGMANMLTQLRIPRHAAWTCLDVGGRRINTSTRDLMHRASWVGLDICPGPEVDIVADAATWIPDQRYQLVQSTELFEHTPDWRRIVATCARATRRYGYFLFTCASTGREPHGADGTIKVPPGQHYGNVPVADLRIEMRRWFEQYEVAYRFPPGDAYGWGILPRDTPVDDLMD